MARLVALTALVLGLALLCVVRPRIPASWVARGWRLVSQRGPSPQESEPAWVIYYLAKLPHEARPAEAKALEDWVRALGGALLALPVFLILALLVLSP